MISRLLVLAACVTITGGAQDADPTPPDAKRIQGTWQILKGLKDGKPAPKEMVESQLTFDAKTITISSPRGGEPAVEYKLDPKKKPAEIDIIPPAKGGPKGVVQGIYKFEKDELTLVFSQPGADRPKTFEDSKASLMVLRRQKKDKK